MEIPQRLFINGQHVTELRPFGCLEPKLVIEPAPHRGVAVRVQRLWQLLPQGLGLLVVLVDELLASGLVDQDAALCEAHDAALERQDALFIEVPNTGFPCFLDKGVPQQACGQRVEGIVFSECVVQHVSVRG